jgi:hypothetical protein
LVTGNTKDRIHIDEHTAVTRWKGERMDYGLAVQVLWGKEVRGGAFHVGREGEGAFDPKLTRPVLKAVTRMEYRHGTARSPHMRNWSRQRCQLPEGH